MVGHLLAVPAGADPEQEPAVGDAVDRRDLLGGRDRVALDDQADAGADEQPLGRRRGGGQRDERVVDPPVLVGQLAAGRIGRLAADRDVGVLGEPERLEAVLLGAAARDRAGWIVSAVGKIVSPNFTPAAYALGSRRGAAGSRSASSRRLRNERPTRRTIIVAGDAEADEVEDGQVEADERRSRGR